MGTVAEVVRLGAPVVVALLSFWLGLRAADFDVRWPWQNRRLLGRALLAVLIVAPAAVVLAAWLLPLPAPLRLGLVVMAIAPGPPMALRKASATGEASFALALEVGLLALGVVFVPLAVALLAATFHRDVTLAPGAVAGVLLTRQLAPLLLGLALGRVLPALARRLQRPLGVLVNALLAALVLILLAATGRAVLALGGAALATLAAFAAGEALIGHALGGPERGCRPVLATFTAMRHPGLALLLASATAPGRALISVIVAQVLMTTLVLGIYRAAVSGSPRPAPRRAAELAPPAGVSPRRRGAR